MKEIKENVDEEIKQESPLMSKKMLSADQPIVFNNLNQSKKASKPAKTIAPDNKSIEEKSNEDQDNSKDSELDEKYKDRRREKAE